MVPPRRAAARRRRSPRSPPTCSTRSSPSKIAASTAIPGIDPIGIGRAVVRDLRDGGRRRRRQHADAAAGAHAVPLERPDATAARSKEAGIALLIEAQLTKTQILELYLNRVYLSAGVYGVETMSEHLFRKPASAAHRWPKRRSSPVCIRAPSALSPWSNYDGALERSHLVLARDARAGFITAAQEEAARARAAAHPAVPPAERSRAAAGRRTICGSSSATSSAATTRRTGRSTRRSGPSCRTRPSGRWRPGSSGCTGPGSRRRSSRSIRRPATSSRWSAAPTTRAAPSTARRAAGASRDRRSSRSSTPRRSSTAIRRCRCCRTCGTSRRRAIPSGVRATPTASSPTQLTLRAALLESNNAGRGGSAAAGRLARRAAAGERRRARAVCPTCRRSRSAPGSSRRSISPRPTRCFRAAARSRGRAAIVSVFDADGAQVLDRAGRARAAHQSGRSRFRWSTHAARRRSSAAPARRSARSACAGRSAARPARPTTIATPGLSGFRRSVVVGVWVGFDQPAPIGRDAYGARVALPIWADFMKRTARQLPAREFAGCPAACAQKSCAACRTCSRSRGARPIPSIFKEGDSVPSALCPVHRGTLKQRATRAIEGFFRGLGSKIAGIFRR